MAKRILVIGLGRFGAAVAEALAQHGCEVVAADNDMNHIDAIKNRVTYALELDATDVNALRSIDPTSCHAAVVAVGEHFENAVLTVAALREVGVQTIIARAISPRHGRILMAAGANRVIEIEAEMGRALGRELAGGADLASQATATVLHAAGVAPAGAPPPGAMPPPGGPLPR
ncbi:MAG: TrkA family potassium uptake protein [Deltaproteobacteria bacterium]|jgi:trk system potassium uptake protein TrkA|nr:TrkA family potassium uptake protein [Deltaproteobacteria bacterium]MBK8714410.1 TrkA family potassium uptake protein [Deltaproteobacteria bacterium]MBP7289113.1 TrkA family potassium uptake protein [Nannocystaceae bacterium]